MENKYYLKKNNFILVLSLVRTHTMLSLSRTRTTVSPPPQASLQNVAGFDEISSGQISWIGAEIGAGLRNVGAETGKP